MVGVGLGVGLVVGPSWPGGTQYEPDHHYEVALVAGLESETKEEPASMPKIQLKDIAHARSGDKGDTVNIGVIAKDPAHYDLLVEELTADRVEAHFGDMVKGGVERFELPNLGALNFLLHNALGGGGTVSLMTDAQGKTFSTALLRIELDIPHEKGE